MKISSSPPQPPKRRRVQTFVAAVLAVGSIGLLVWQVWSPVESKVAWRTDLGKALTLAESQNKSVVIDFYADWCGPCRQMTRTTFQDDRVVQRLKGVIPVKIDTDVQRDVALRYRIAAMPTTVILSPTGQLLARQVGYLNARDYLALLDQSHVVSPAARKDGA